MSLPAIDRNSWEHSRVVDSSTRSRPGAGPSRQWRRPIPEERIRHYSWLAASAIATSVAVSVGVIIVFIALLGAWLFAAHGAESTEQVVRVSGDAWLGTHLVPVLIGNFPLGLVPTAFLALPVLCLWRATQWALKSSQPTSSKEFWRMCFAMSGMYAAMCGLVSVISHSDQVSTSRVAAVIHGAVLALVVTTLCVLSYAPSRTMLIDRLPYSVVTGMRIGASVAAALFVISSLILTVVLAMSWSKISSSLHVVTGGGVDGFYLTCLMIGYLPTAAIWVLAYVAGPGVLLGGHGMVSLTAAHPGALPAFPLLSILPTSAPSWAQGLLLIPAGLGIGLYFALPRDHWSPSGPRFVDYVRGIIRRSEVSALCTAVGTLGFITWILATAASGSLGHQLLRSVGPHAPDTALWVMGLCGGSAVVLLITPRALISLVHAIRQYRTSQQPQE